MADTATFNDQTSASAHDVRVVIPTYDGGIVGYSMDLPPEVSSAFKANIGLNELDVEKLEKIEGMDDLNPSAKYYGFENFKDVVEINYNSAMKQAVYAYNGLRDELYPGDEKWDMLDDVDISDRNNLGWEATFYELDSLEKEASASPMAEDITYLTNIAMRSLYELQNAGAMAGYVAEMYSDYKAPSPFSEINRIDLTQYEIDGINTPDDIASSPVKPH